MSLSNGGLELDWGGETLLLCPEKVVFWKKRKVLLVADTHFGKAATFRKSGIPVPETSSRDDCLLLEKLVSRTKAEALVFLGDFLHAREGRTEEVRLDLIAWRERLPRLELHLVRGNHDLRSGDPWPELGIECHPEPWREYEFELRHHPVERSSKPYLAGHVHPGFALREKGGTSLRAPCFQVGENRIILPAFGDFTGLRKVVPGEGDRIFMTDGREVLEVPARGWKSTTPNGKRKV